MGLKRKLVCCLAVLCVAGAPSGVAAADPDSAAPGRSNGLVVTPNLPWVPEPRSAVFGAQTLPYLQQVQTADQWCWAADGSSIATYLHRPITQNDYCKIVHGAGADGSCPNDSASLEQIAAAFHTLGFDAAVGAPLSMTKVVDEISANRPVLTGIAWTAGGGHAQVVYGFDVDAGTITYGDPWPSSRRSVTQTIGSYTQNSDWVWFGEDYGIVAR
ncbi:papain-like cysteine protease family protein [Nocardia pseudobrasiliensis]|uniref:Papain like cysteine protease AvrRpt2 n=1 Tax=Nocardia pseudobrasiliensis TaxID=45979 RepID=A0A370IB26_9NOCA|nr:papain-like cysteine protease family protein [Nocardia pseudobrasiliensis]RDI67923.1 papain like cysteine protease AvrRpt2 [Nocardia pseudobrasiliensis]